MSSSVGAFVLASFCEDKKIKLCFCVASSNALIDRCRPTNSGTTICGNTIVSRRGSNGTLTGPEPCSLSSFFSLRNNITITLLSALCSLCVYDDRRLMLFHDILRNHHFLDIRLGGHVVHDIQHDVFHDRT